MASSSATSSELGSRALTSPDFRVEPAPSLSRRVFAVLREDEMDIEMREFGLPMLQILVPFKLKTKTTKTP